MVEVERIHSKTVLVMFVLFSDTRCETTNIVTNIRHEPRLKTITCDAIESKTCVCVWVRILGGMRNVLFIEPSILKMIPRINRSPLYVMRHSSNIKIPHFT